ncbi:hypothetical protein DVH24_022285 [Malus domestica]|uniref:Uncharacterized protein n=1 Tax=Malus domestica TaxID=3750 RepID=A0A498KLU8_MALDO|nr:hypothetical protein DVH24_022285 [Malus domestica]
MVCYMLIWYWVTPHIANWFYGKTLISSWYQSGLSSWEAKRSHVLHVIQLLSMCRLENPPHSRLSSCEAKRPHTLHVIQLLFTCRLENPPHVRGRVESCPTSMRDKVC